MKRLKLTHLDTRFMIDYSGVKQTLKQELRHGKEWRGLS